MVKILGAVMTGFACGYLGFKISFTMKIRAESLNNIITSLENARKGNKFQYE